tara:strand:- start:14901 stop:16850 length:1950 start_codon:yes stop_codon:yes gene_type:complete
MAGMDSLMKQVNMWLDKKHAKEELDKQRDFDLTSMLYQHNLAVEKMELQNEINQENRAYEIASDIYFQKQEQINQKIENIYKVYPSLPAEYRTNVGDLHKKEMEELDYTDTKDLQELNVMLNNRLNYLKDLDTNLNKAATTGFEDFRMKHDVEGAGYLTYDEFTTGIKAITDPIEKAGIKAGYGKLPYQYKDRTYEGDALQKLSQTKEYFDNQDTKDLKTTASHNFKMLQSVFTVPEGETWEKRAKQIGIDPNIGARIQMLTTAGSYEEFLDILNDNTRTSPNDREIILNTLYGNDMTRQYMTGIEASHTTVQVKLGFQNQENGNTHITAYQESLKDESFKDQDQAFNHLYSRLENETDHTVHQDLLTVIGTQMQADGLDTASLVPDWQAFWLNKQQVQPIVSAPTLFPAATSFVNQGNSLVYGEEISDQAKQVYDLLDSATMANLDDNTLKLLDSINNFSMTDHGRVVTGSGTKYEGKPNWSLATSFGGGWMGHDSPYYDSLYDQLDDQYTSLVSEEDPWGWDRLYYGLFTTEKGAAVSIGERYGEDVYKSAVTSAHSGAKEDQLKYITRILEGKESVEEQQDLMRTIDILLKTRNVDQVRDENFASESNEVEEAYQRYLQEYDEEANGAPLTFGWFSQMYELDPTQW